MNDPNLSLELNPVSGPAAKLIGAVRDAVGIPNAPVPAQGRKKSKATVKTRSNGGVEAPAFLARGKTPSAIELRASERLARREIRRQENIEQITKKAVDALPASVSAEPADGAGIGCFVESCQDATDEQMRTFWARMLAAEVATPGSISLRAVRAVREMAPGELAQFAGLCQFVWVIQGFGLAPVIQDLASPCFAEAGLVPETFPQLAALGLISFNEAGSYGLQKFSGTTAFYYGRSHAVSAPTGGRELLLGRALLTSVGKELAPHAGSAGHEAYRASVVAQWRASGLNVQE